MGTGQSSNTVRYSVYSCHFPPNLWYLTRLSHSVHYSFIKITRTLPSLSSPSPSNTALWLFPQH